LRIERSVIGMTSPQGVDPGAEIEAWRLEAGPGIAVEIWTYGATLVDVSVPDRAGTVANVCYRLRTLEDYMSLFRHHYVGPVFGRFARCVAGGRFELDGQAIQLDRNIGAHHFHGGRGGFHSRVWTAASRRADDRLALQLRLDSPAGDQGYPGNLVAEATYTLDRKGVLSIDLTARADSPTIVDLTTHAFWNLAGAGTIDDHLLRLSSDYLVPTDNEFIALREPPHHVAGTAVDFRAERRIADQSMDNCVILNVADGPAAILTDPGSGRRMTVMTNQPALALYSGDHLPVRRAGLCIQPGNFPDAPNRPDFPPCRLDPGTVYQNHMEFRFDAI